MLGSQAPAQPHSSCPSCAVSPPAHRASGATGTGSVLHEASGNRGGVAPILNFIFTVCSSPLSSTSKISRKMCHWCLWPCLSTSSTFQGHCEDLLTTLSPEPPFSLWWSSEGACRIGNPRNWCWDLYPSGTLISINKFLFTPSPKSLILGRRV